MFVEKCKGNVAMVWFDVHPDIILPGDIYPVCHAMDAPYYPFVSINQLLPLLRLS